MDHALLPFAALATGDALWLRLELLRRAACGFEVAERWLDAAACWADLGEHARAAAIYTDHNDLEHAALALLNAGAYAEACERYRAWETRLAAGDDIPRVTAMLGQAACHLLASRRQTNRTLSPTAGRAAYRSARAAIAAVSARSPRDAVPCWTCLAEYGNRLGRLDLIQEGYEEALARLGDSPRQPWN